MARTRTNLSARTRLWTVGVASEVLHLTRMTRLRFSRSARIQSARPVARRGRTEESDGAQEDPRVAEEDHARTASSPVESPAKGWKDIFLRVYHGITEDRLAANAAGGPFFLLLALFPGVADLIALYGLSAPPQRDVGQSSPNTLHWITEALSTTAAAAVQLLVRAPALAIRRFAKDVSPTQDFEGGLAQHAAAGKSGKFDLGDKLRLGPRHIGGGAGALVVQTGFYRWPAPFSLLRMLSALR